MDVRIETLPSVEVVYCQRLGPYEESAPAAWQALWAWIRENELGGRVRGAYGFGLDDPGATPPEALRYDACLALAGAAAADAAAGIGVQRLPGGRYAIGRLQGVFALAAISRHDPMGDSSERVMIGIRKFSSIIRTRAR